MNDLGRYCKDCKNADAAPADVNPFTFCKAAKPLGEPVDPVTGAPYQFVLSCRMMRLTSAQIPTASPDGLFTFMGCGTVGALFEPIGALP